VRFCLPLEIHLNRLTAVPKPLRWILGGLLCIGAIALFVNSYILPAALCLIIGLGVMPMPIPKLPRHMDKEHRKDKAKDEEKKA
jgi:hypothetical protein